MAKEYHFEISVTCRHEECTDIFKNIVIQKLMKLSRFHPHIINGTIVVDKKNSSKKVEISLHVPGSVITSLHEDYDDMKAFEGALKKVKV